MNNELSGSWKNSELINKIKDFVRSACDKNSAGYIPPEDRIVVADFDGTLISERGTKVDNDAMCFRTPEEARDIFAGMKDEFFDEKRGLTYGKYLFKPMRELLNYLSANGFEIFFVSGNCNALTYALANYFFGADYAHSIGSNIELAISETGEFDMRPTGKYEGSWCEVKCYRIYNQIGKCPVMAFGNSDGDVQMLRWVVSNKKYQSLAVMVNHDDEREYVYNCEEVDGYCNRYGFENLRMSENFEMVYIE